MKNERQGNRVVAITGAASGIGRALALRCAQDGVTDLALLDRDVAALKTLGQEMAGRPGRVLTLRCDVTNASDSLRAVRRIGHDLGRLDVLVNNAGITQISSFERTRPDVFRRVMDVNFMGAVLCTQAALPLLRESRGLIAVTSSIAGLAPLPGRTGYCASKFALHGCFETLRVELRSAGVGVLLVCPGFTQTNLKDETADRNTSEGRPMVGNLETPERVAEAIYQAIRRRKKRLVLTVPGKMAALMVRFLPDVYERVIFRKIQRQLES